MEENNNQTIQTPATESSKTVAKKSNNLLIIVLLVLILAVLGGLLAYQYLGKSGEQAENTSDKDVSEKVTQDVTLPNVVTETGTGTETETGAGTETGATTGGTEPTVVKADIDKDLQSFDELDLSSIENDYSEDLLSGF